MTLDFLGGAIAGFLAGVGVRHGWKPIDDPRGRAEAVARVRWLEGEREKPHVDEMTLARIMDRWWGAK